MILFVLFLSIFLLTGNTTIFEISYPDFSKDVPSSPNRKQGPQKELVVYRMIFQGLWSEERFPKSYPKFRPPAQWSIVFGQIHNSSYHVFHLGENSSSALQNFAERGDPRSLANSQGDDSIFDQFTAPHIRNGTGTSTQDIIVDVDHSLVSIVSRIVPSPDWFVGVDSLDLIKDGVWIDNVTILLQPFDAGSDGGLTFTSPKWRLQTLLPIQMHTSKEPSHLAASFYYPDKNFLPDIAQVTFTKLSEINLEPEEVSSIDETSTMIYTEETTGTTEEAMNSSEYPTSDGTEVSTAPLVVTPLLTSTLEMIGNITSKYRISEAYSPKLFRPDIIYISSKKDKKKTQRQGAQSNLRTSFISISRNKTNSMSSFFNW